MGDTTRWQQAAALCDSVDLNWRERASAASLFELALAELEEDHEAVWTAGYEAGRQRGAFEALYNRKAELAGKAVEVPAGYDMQAFNAGYQAALNDFAPGTKVNGSYSVGLMAPSSGSSSPENVVMANSGSLLWAVGGGVTGSYSFDPNGVKSVRTCSRCGGTLDASRTSVCTVCEPDQ